MDIKSLTSDGGRNLSLSDLLNRERLIPAESQAGGQLAAPATPPANTSGAASVSAVPPPVSSVPAASLDVVELSSKNIMSRNFAGESEGGSRYIKAALSGLAMQRQADNRFMGMVESLRTTMAVELEKAGKYNAGSTIYRVSKRTGGMLEQDKQEEVNKGAKVHLDQTRREIEEGAMPAELLEAPAANAEVALELPGDGQGASEVVLPDLSAGPGAAAAPEVSINVVV